MADKKAPILIYVEPELRRALQVQADANERSLSVEGRRAIWSYLDDIGIGLRNSDGSRARGKGMAKDGGQVVDV